MSTSKTARQAMNAGAVREAKADPFATNEAKIAELRKQRTAKLSVVRYDFIDALIEEYDIALATISLRESEVANLKATGNSEGVPSETEA